MTDLVDTPVLHWDNKYRRRCGGGHCIVSSTDMTDMDSCPAVIGTVRDGEWLPGARPCGRSMRGWYPDDEDEGE